eukprot:6331988-Pyramimonas_sp.AAC.1
MRLPRERPACRARRRRGPRRRRPSQRSGRRPRSCLHALTRGAPTWSTAIRGSFGSRVTAATNAAEGTTNRTGQRA